MMNKSYVQSTLHCIYIFTYILDVIRLPFAVKTRRNDECKRKARGPEHSLPSLRSARPVR